MATEDKIPTESNTTPYTMRVTKEATERVQILLDKTGLTMKDLFTTMVEGLEAKLIIETSPDQDRAMQQIRYHLGRVDSVFLGMAQKVVDVTADFTQRFDTQTLKNQEVLDRLTQEKFQLIKEVEIAKETVGTISEALVRNDEQLSELNERAKADKLTISILSKKVEALEIEVQSVPPLTKQIETLKQMIKETNEANAALKRELADANREGVRLAEESGRQIMVLNREHEQTIKHLTEMHESSAREHEQKIKRYLEVRDTTVYEHEQEIKRINEVNELKLQHVVLKIESEVSKAKQKGNEEQISLMREHNQLIKDHAILQSKYEALVPRKNT